MAERLLTDDFDLYRFQQQGMRLTIRMAERLLTDDFELRGQLYEIWSDHGDRYLVDPRKNEVVDTDHVFNPPLTNEELLAIYDYGKGY